MWTKSWENVFLTLMSLMGKPVLYYLGESIAGGVAVIFSRSVSMAKKTAVKNASPRKRTTARKTIGVIVVEAGTPEPFYLMDRKREPYLRRR